MKKIEKAVARVRVSAGGVRVKVRRETKDGHPKVNKYAVWA